MSANEIQVGGSHYAAAFQHWDWAAICFGPGYFKGQITKYVYRWKKKNGVEDLNKALHFLDKMIEVDWITLGWTVASPAVYIDKFVDENEVDQFERAVILQIACATDKADLEVARGLLAELIRCTPPEGEPTRSYVNQDYNRSPAQ